MKHLSLITSLGFFIILLFTLIKLLDFYGVGVDIFGSYFAFYLFLILSIFILANK
jgi:hypothetical protein